jgi:peptide chain release factor 1
VYADADRLRAIGQERSGIEPLVSTFREYREALASSAATTAMLADEADPQMVAMIAAEVAQLTHRVSELEARLHDLLVPADPYAARDVIVEIRAGTGGEEAGLFAADLARMYTRYAEARGWRTEVIESSETGLGALKDVVLEVRGTGAYARLKWESGVHRVQRVPQTEAQGRVHTSTATVAVLPQVDEVEIHIPESDLRVDVFRSSGPGGQSVNTTDSAVRITHLPTGLVVSCQDQKSQLQNRRKGLQVLRARLHQIEEERLQADRSAERRNQIGSGERAEKIRTYNFPQNRVTDHRIGLTLHRLDAVMLGDLDELIDTLQEAEKGRQLEAA